MNITSVFLATANAELPAVRLDDGRLFFSVQETCQFAGICAKSNASKWARNNVPSKWLQEIKTSEGGGRPGLYFTQAGFLFAICQGKTEPAMKARDALFEVINCKDLGQVNV